MNEADEAMPTEFQPSTVSARMDPTVPPPLPADHGPGTSMAEVKESSGRDQQRTVPYGALAEERARRKELQRKLQNAIESQQRLQGRLDLLHELAQQQGVAEAAGGGEPPAEDE